MTIRNRLGLTILLLSITVLLIALEQRLNHSITIADFCSAYTLALAIYALEAWKDQKKQENLLAEFRTISKSLVTLIYASEGFLKNAQDTFSKPELRTNQHEIGELYINDITSAHNEILTYLALHSELDPDSKIPIDKSKHVSLIESVYEVQAILKFFCTIEIIEGFQYSTANDTCEKLRKKIDDCQESAMKELKKRYRA